MVAGIAMGVVLAVLLTMGVIHVYNLGFSAGRKYERDKRDER